LVEFFSEKWPAQMKNIIMIRITLLLFINISVCYGTIYEYDSLNRLSRVTYDGGFQITYMYDEVGNRTELIATILPDIAPNGLVNLEDFTVMAEHWLNSDCGEPDWCGLADIDRDANVGTVELNYLANWWLKESAYDLATSVIGGHGSIMPLSDSYAYGTVVPLTAIPDSGYQVNSWSGTDNDSTQNKTNTVAMVGSKTVTVEFETSYALNTSVIGGNGVILPASGNYERGTTVELQAVPDEGYHVKSWSGTDNDSLTTVQNTVTMNSGRTVTVEFQSIGELIPMENSGFETGDFTGWSLITDWPSEASVVSPGFSGSIHKAYLRAWEEWIPEGEIFMTGRIELSRTVPVEIPSCYQVVFDYERMNNSGVTISINGANYSLNEGVNHFEEVAYTGESISIIVTLNGNGYAELYLDNFKIYRVDSGSTGDTTIVNGGFELGDFTNWQILQSDPVNTYYSVWDTPLTEGNYSAEIDAWSDAEIHLRSINLIHAGVLSFDYWAMGTEAYVLINGQQYALNTTENVVSFSMPIVTPIYQFEVVLKGETYMLIDNCQIQPL
jgi:YD repeat-containing protein